MTRYSLLRHVRIEGYRLKLYDTNTRGEYNKSRLAFGFFDPDGKLLFSGTDFCCAPAFAVDSDDAIRSLLGFLTLKPGDTDDEYFQDYTPAQLAFTESSDCEELSMWACEDSDLPFDNVQFENELTL